MTDYTNADDILSLYDLNVLIQNTINHVFYGRYFWVKAELHKLNYYRHSGHAYPELLEKRENEVVCQMKGIIWKNDLQRIHQKFQNTIGEPLKDNITALLYVSVKYDPKYGLSIQIKDIDPNYTLGELEKQKKQTIEKLKSEGIFDANKKLELPIVIQRVAVISVETSKGYRDLITTFQKYEQGFNIVYDLYPSLLQGEAAAIQIKETLNHILKKADTYDAVLIIRGGGGEVGLSCYNDYELCKTIATYPIPVITGIGHSTNFTVTEMVAHHNGITPTDVAMFIIHKSEDFEQRLTDIQSRLIQYIQSHISSEKNLLKQFSNQIVIYSKEIFYQQNTAIREYEQYIRNTALNITKNYQHRLFHAANKIKHQAFNVFFQNEKNIEAIFQKLKYFSDNVITSQSSKLKELQKQISQNTYQYLQFKNIMLSNIEKHLHLLHPANIMKRGYSIVFDAQDKVVKNAENLSENEKIKIKFFSSELEGTIHSLKIKKYESE